MELSFLVAQVSGCLSIAAGIWAAGQVSDRRLIWGNVICNMLVALQMVLLGAYATAIVSVLASIRLFAADRTSRTDVMLFFMGLMLGQWMLVGRMDELVLILGMLLSTYGYFKLQGAKLRVALVIMNVLWVPTMLSTGAYLYAAFCAFVSVQMTWIAYKEISGRGAEPATETEREVSLARQ